MMKKVKLGALLLLSTLSFISCESTQTEKPVIKYLKAEKVIDDFIRKNPNWNQNSVILEKSEASLQGILVPLINSSSLYDDLPMKLTMLESLSESMRQLKMECSDCENTNTALFEFDNRWFHSDRIAYGFNLKMVSTVSDSIANKLKTGEVYYIKGKVLKIESALSMLEPVTSESRKVDVLLPSIDIEPIEIVPVPK